MVAWQWEKELLTEQISEFDPGLGRNQTQDGNLLGVGSDIVVQEFEQGNYLV